MSEPSARKTPFWKDSLLLAAELLGRQVYWRLPRLRAWVKRRRAGRRHPPQVAGREELKDYLRSIGVTEGALVMAHTSVSGLCLADCRSPRNRPVNVIASARQLMADLLELVGETGTLVMPTHAAYQNAEQCADRPTPDVYDPANTPCFVGLVSELFWRSRGVQRSLHPVNMLAACGPLASELLQDNLNDSKPLPHGIHSGYYRFCQRNGLVVSIGIPLRQCMTLTHAAEEVRDEQWPVKDFFKEKPYILQIKGQRKTCVVRETRVEYRMFCMCAQKMYRDLSGAGILHDGMVGTVHVGWARAGEVFQYLMTRNRNSSYPYYWPQLARRKA